MKTGFACLLLSCASLYADDILGTSSDDSITGTAGNDFISLLDGNDHLYGEAGDDALIGGVGNDWLIGGTGDDEYRFDTGEGRNLITETYESGSDNKIVFGAGIDESQIHVIRVGDSLALVDLESSLTVEISNWFSDPSEPLARVIFADQTEWSAAYLTSIATSDGDLNEDGISDSSAYLGGLSLIDEDPDGDGISTAIELTLGLNPFLADSDGDGIDDSLDYGNSVPSNDPLVITIDSPLSAVLTN